MPIDCEGGGDGECRRSIWVMANEYESVRSRTSRLIAQRNARGIGTKSTIFSLNRLKRDSQSAIRLHRWAPGKDMAFNALGTQEDA